MLIFTKSQINTKWYLYSVILRIKKSVKIRIMILRINVVYCLGNFYDSLNSSQPGHFLND